MPRTAMIPTIDNSSIVVLNSKLWLKYESTCQVFEIADGRELLDGNRNCGRARTPSSIEPAFKYQEASRQDGSYH